MGNKKPYVALENISEFRPIIEMVNSFSNGKITYNNPIPFQDYFVGTIETDIINIGIRGNNYDETYSGILEFLNQIK